MWQAFRRRPAMERLLLVTILLLFLLGAMGILFGAPNP